MAKPAEGELEEMEVRIWGRRFHAPTGFLMAAAAVSLVVLAGSIFLAARKKNDPVSGSDITIEPPLGKTVISPEFDLDENSQPHVAMIADAYANAKTADEVLPLVRDAARVGPAIRAAWQPMSSAGKWKIPATAKWTLHLVERREFGILRGESADAVPFRFYFVKENGRIVLDWEASTGHSETPYPILSAGEGEGGLIRGFISPSDYYSLTLPETDFQCYRITSPDTQIAVWAYARRSTEETTELRALFTKGNLPRKIQPEYRITLRLRKPPAPSQANQWGIDEMVHLEWVSPS